MANKLELTWYGKDEPIQVEPRLLIENTALSNTAADPDTQNIRCPRPSRTAILVHPLLSHAPTLIFTTLGTSNWIK